MSLLTLGTARRGRRDGRRRAQEENLDHRAPASGRDDGRMVCRRAGEAARGLGRLGGRSGRAQALRSRRVLHRAEHESRRQRARQPAHQRGRRQPESRMDGAGRRAQPRGAARCATRFMQPAAICSSISTATKRCRTCSSRAPRCCRALPNRRRRSRRRSSKRSSRRARISRTCTATQRASTTTDALKLASKYIGNEFGCLSLTLEMPFKDNANLPDERVGWNGERSAALGAAMLQAILRHVQAFDLRPVLARVNKRRAHHGSVITPFVFIGARLSAGGGGASLCPLEFSSPTSSRCFVDFVLRFARSVLEDFDASRRFALRRVLALGALCLPDDARARGSALAFDGGTGSFQPNASICAPT